MYWFTLTQHSSIEATKDRMAMIARYSPFVEIGTRLKQSEFKPDGVGEVGLCLRDKYSEIMADEDMQYAEHYSPCRCIIGIVRANVRNDYYDVLNPMWKYAAEEKLIPDGDAVSIQMATEMYVKDCDEPFDYYFCYLPVKF